ncbi:hypothetical protein PAXINDRAFT_157675 [Paxillus involutus ATCC 200175]|uniref:SAM domain-containing protein n=1 Tax=Paxillus involutus ATCC 200175 TaxID=664439 RepID=A0A0C9TR50_PAXIN|nr:hypothetical protein PAXINDRAFT_157675 [Paxillus involutus ATCC 200175]
MEKGKGKEKEKEKEKEEKGKSQVQDTATQEPLEELVVVKDSWIDPLRKYTEGRILAMLNSKEVEGGLSMFWSTQASHGLEYNPSWETGLSMFWSTQASHGLEYNPSWETAKVLASEATAVINLSNDLEPIEVDGDQSAAEGEHGHDNTDESETRAVQVEPVIKLVIPKRGGKTKASEEVKPVEERKVVLVIPNAASEGVQQISIVQNKCFGDVLQAIHEVIGCQKVAHKPMLLYKLSSAAQKDDPMNISTQDDWDGCLEEVEVAEKKKKGVVTYMSSLRAKGKKKPTNSKNKKASLLDLDNDDNDDSGEEDEDAMEKKKKALHDLEKTLCACQLCGPTKFCKVNRTGKHISLSFNQRRGWSVALAHETSNVTLKTPPKGELFIEFHSVKLVSDDNPHKPTSFAPGIPLSPYTYPFPPGYGWLMMPQPHWGMQVPSQQTPSSERRRRNETPSSPPDFDIMLDYPTIAGFLEKLNAAYPQHGLPIYAARFEAVDFYNINELASLSEERLTTMEFGMSLGNARFLLKEVKGEMRKVERKKRARIE